MTEPRLSTDSEDTRRVDTGSQVAGFSGSSRFRHVPAGTRQPARHVPTTTRQVIGVLTFLRLPPTQVGGHSADLGQ